MRRVRLFCGSCQANKGENMTTFQRQTPWCGSVLPIAIIALGCAGCQTFNLSEEDFEKQRRGQPVDREMGAAVAAIGTVGYYSAMLGAAVATALRK